MAIKIYMPSLSPTMTDGTLNKWHVKIGDQVNAGDILAEIETDKATMEVEAVDQGKITKLLVKEGDIEVPVNSVIAILDGENEKEEIEVIDKTQIKDHDDLNKNVDESKKNQNNFDNKELDKIEKKNKSDSPNRIFASPLVKKISMEQKIKLDDITGSGPNGRIIKRDLENISLQDSKLNINELGFKPSSMRRIIAENTTSTKQKVPHFYLTIESNVDKLIEMRRNINKIYDSKISINDILVKALALAQKQNPKTNVSWKDDKIIKYKSVDVSVAVALDDGLITPIIKNADEKGLKEISLEIKDLANKAKNNKLTPEQYQGGTISISNLGMYGITEFSAIINPPQSSILAVGTINKVPGIVKDEIKIINQLKSTLSADHRTLDGAVAGKLLKDFNDIIEEPYSLWLNSNDMEVI